MGSQHTLEENEILRAELRKCRSTLKEAMDGFIAIENEDCPHCKSAQWAHEEGLRIHEFLPGKKEPNDQAPCTVNVTDEELFGDDPGGKK